MRASHNEVLNVRLPGALRADLDDAARASGAKVSMIARDALRCGLRIICPDGSGDDRGPPPGAPAASLPAAA